MAGRAARPQGSTRRVPHGAATAATCATSIGCGSRASMTALSRPCRSGAVAPRPSTTPAAWCGRRRRRRSDRAVGREAAEHRLRHIARGGRRQRVKRHRERRRRHPTARPTPARARRRERRRPSSPRRPGRRRCRGAAPQQAPRRAASPALQLCKSCGRPCKTDPGFTLPDRGSAVSETPILIGR